MKRLHRMIIGAYLGPLLVTFVIVLFILVMQFLWKYVDDLMGKGLAWYDLARLLLFATASFVPLALPLGVLLSSIMTLGGLGENTELTPMRSAGLGLFRILAPLIVLVVGIAGFSFYFSNNLLPVANLKFHSLLWDVTRTKPALNIRPGVFYNGIEGFSIRVKEKDEEAGVLHDVLIYDHRDARQSDRTVVHAERGTMQRSVDGDFLVLTLENGTIHDERAPDGGKGRFPLVRGRFEKDVIRLDLSGFGLDRTDEDLFKENYKMLTMGQLQYAEDSLERHYQERLAAHRHYLRNSLSILRDTAAMLPSAPHREPPEPKASAVDEPRLHEIASNLVRNQINYLDRTLEERRGRGEQLAGFHIEWHRKLTLAVACVLMFFIGSPLGAIIRKGGMGLPTVFAILFFLVFHILSYSTERLVKAGKLDAWPGMWISAMVLLPIGLWLTWKAATDSPLLDRDAYYRALDRLRTRLRPPIGGGGRRRHADPSTVQ